MRIQGIRVKRRTVDRDIPGAFNCLRIEDGTAILFHISCKMPVISVYCLGGSQITGG